MSINEKNNNLINALNSFGSEEPKNEIADFNNKEIIQYEKLKLLRNGTHSKFEIKFRGQSLPMRLLSCPETEECLMNARLYYMNKPENSRVTLLEDWEYMRQTLSKAFTESPHELYKGYLSMADIRAMSLDTLTSLYKAYNIAIQEMNPNPDELTEEEFMGLVNTIEKKPQLLKDCTRENLERVTYHYMNFCGKLMDMLETNVTKPMDK